MSGMTGRNISGCGGFSGTVCFNYVDGLRERKPLYGLCMMEAGCGAGLFSEKVREQMKLSADAFYVIFSMEDGEIMVCEIPEGAGISYVPGKAGAEE